MALRRQSLSPTANLLRNSRLFSLPEPLPRPNVSEATSVGVVKASDTATLPYPTHQAIATTKSSLARGDWGLKRPLPSRSQLLKVGDPVLRVTQLDSIEHITDFDSAADHVRTRQKWEELGVPVMRGLTQMRDFDRSGDPPGGAFEIRDDTTSYDSDLGQDEAGLYLQRIKQSADRNKENPYHYQPFSPPPVNADVHNSRRWKHEGPWLPGMNAQDFSDYLSKQIAHRRTEFNTYLREFVRNEIYTTRQLAASQTNETAPLDTAEAQQWQSAKAKKYAQISESDLQAGIAALRRETASDPLRSALFNKLIRPFLRLPTIKFKFTSYAADASTRDIDQYSFDQETAPLSTHPSAGLGYLRTKAYITNHPILGPQKTPQPVPARVIQPRSTYQGGKEPYARLGIAGFVANDQFRTTDGSAAMRGQFSNALDVESIDIDTPGGKKIFVQPMFGSVTNDGRILIKLARSAGPEVAVRRGELDDKPPVRENVESEPLRGLGEVRSGVKELDEASELGRKFRGFLEGVRPEGGGKGSPGRGFPGVADALRE